MRNLDFVTQRGLDKRNSLRAAQWLLQPLAVVNPYADELTFPAELTRTRRDHEKYLTLIDTITLLHQHQRTIQTRAVNAPSPTSRPHFVDGLGAERTRLLIFLS